MTPPFYAAGPSGVASSTPLSWRDRLLHALLPAHCLGCAVPLSASRLLGLCNVCHGRLRPLPPGGCAVCRRALPGSVPAGWRCQPCRDDPPAYERLLALWSYEEPLAAVVRGLKFRRLDYLGRHLGELLADRFASDLETAIALVDLIVPVPLHWRRRLHRGYNQAELIAAPLARRLALPLAPLLRRTRATPPQSLLGKPARLANLRRAFRVPHPERLQGRHLLLVDDVATTGATLEAAATVLRKAGAASVTAMTAGRTL